MLGRVRDESEALAVAARIQTALAEPIVIDELRRFVSASVGVAIAEDGAGADGLLRDADTAMYRAKELGSARAALFDASMRQRTLERVELEAGLRGVADRGELSLLYQPAINLDSGRLRGFEALLRWEHPRLGTLQPSAHRRLSAAEIERLRAL